MRILTSLAARSFKPLVFKKICPPEPVRQSRKGSKIPRQENAADVSLWFDAQEVVFTGCDGAGLSGPFCPYPAANLYIQGRQHLCPLRFYANFASDPQRAATDPYRGGVW